jgi:hypothetical protein
MRYGYDIHASIVTQVRYPIPTRQCNLPEDAVYLSGLSGITVAAAHDLRLQFESLGVDEAHNEPQR